MQQLSENVLVLSPGDQFPPMSNDAIKIYLAGSQDLNPAGNNDWQTKIATGTVSLTEGPNAISVFKGRQWIFINPKMAPQMNPEASLANQEYVNKKTWEMDMANACDGIFLNFLQKSTSPLPLFEFGLFASSGKLIVRCPEGYYQYSQVAFTCQRMNITLLPTKANVKDVLWSMANLLPALQQNKAIQLPE